MKILKKSLLCLTIFLASIDNIAAECLQEEIRITEREANNQIRENATPPAHIQALIDKNLDELLALPDNFEGVLDTFPGLYIAQFGPYAPYIYLFGNIGLGIKHFGISTLMVPKFYVVKLDAKKLIFYEIPCEEDIESFTDQEMSDLQALGFPQEQCADLKRDKKTGKIIVISLPLNK